MLEFTHPIKIPRLYHRESPHFNYVKPTFSDPVQLNHLWELKRMLKQGIRIEPTPGSTLALFTYMIGGFGDAITHQEVKKLLLSRCPDLRICSILCAPMHLAQTACFQELDTIVVWYAEDGLPLFSEEILDTLASTDLILSIPTVYPHLNTLKRELENRKKRSIRLLCVGQYGFLESDWFHPQSGHYAMGLHPLEMGVLIRETSQDPDWLTLKNPSLLRFLFGTHTPTPDQITDYLKTHDFYLAYLISATGGAIYLEALLHAKRDDTRTIDLCSPHLGWLINHICAQKKQGRPLLEGEYGIQSLEIHFADRVDTVELQSTGKVVRVFCPPHLSDADFRQLIRLSGDFVAVRGDQSFSEVVSANRLFFYDTPSWARYFIRDLSTLAAHHLADYPSAVTLFHCMEKAALYQQTESPDNLWVEETFFETRPPWTELAHACGEALRNSKTRQGYTSLNQLICSDYACNDTLCKLILACIRFGTAHELRFLDL